MKGEPHLLGRMTTSSPPLVKAEEEDKEEDKEEDMEEEEIDGTPVEEPIEESANPSPLVVVPLSPPPAAIQEEPETGPHATQCQSWLLEMLDDVRYLISCTNWY